jgi:hypothetical protein
MALMNEAESSIKADPSKATALQTISMAYNMARLQEATGAVADSAADVARCRVVRSMRAGHAVVALL